MSSYYSVALVQNSASSLAVTCPHCYCNILVADLVKYRLSAVVSLLCYGTPIDHPLAVPGSGPSAVAVPNVAGGNPEPMDDETMFQPVVAYFTFIQNNLSQITSGNTLQVMREAEQRHLQIMHGAVDSIRNEWSSRLVMQEQEYEQRLQEVEGKAISALNEERKRGDEMEVRLNQAQASHDKRIEDVKAEANTKHDQKIAEERQRIT